MKIPNLKGNWHAVLTFSLLILLVLVVVGNVFYEQFDNLIFLQILDSYFKIVLTSWPAAVLIVAILLLTKHHAAIDYFIRNRMTGIGLDGVKGDVVTASATEGELKTKNVTDATDEAEIDARQNAPLQLTIENNVGTPAPNTIRQEVYERYKQRAAVEDRMQTLLIAKFRDLYKPYVKLSLGSDRSIVLDGLFTTYSGSLRAVEIKYIGKSGYASLRYTLSSLAEKLHFFGIKHLMAIIIVDNLDEERAIEINETLKLRTKRYFFSLQNDQLVEISIPPKYEKLLEQ